MFPLHEQKAKTIQISSWRDNDS